MPLAARQTDMHACPKVEPGPTPHVGGPIQTGSPDVDIEFLPAARASADAALCAAGGPDKIAQGCGTVTINGKPAARLGDMTSHGGVIVAGAGTVEIGVAGDAVTVAAIKGAGGAGAPGPAEGEGKGGERGQAGGEGEGQGEDAGESGAAGAAGSPSTGSTPQAPGTQNPHAIFRVFDAATGDPVSIGEKFLIEVDDLIAGDLYDVRSISYDPDATPTGEPLKGIVSHNWTASFSFIGSPTSTTISFKAPPPGRYDLTLEVQDADGNTDTTRAVAINTRSKYTCETAKAHRDAAIRNIVAAEMLGREQTKDTWFHWLKGSGAEKVYDPEWYRDNSVVSEAESEIAGIIADKLTREHAKDSRKSTVTWDGTKRVGQSVWDLGTSFGMHTLKFQGSATLYQGGGSWPLSGPDTFRGTVYFTARDRFNWHKGKGYFGFTPGGVGLADDALWQVVEDCGHAKPFDMRVSYARQFEMEIGGRFRWLT